jgi:hypothetical protein
MLVSAIGYFKNNKSVDSKNSVPQVKSTLNEGFGHVRDNATCSKKSLPEVLKTFHNKTKKQTKLSVLA